MRVEFPTAAAIGTTDVDAAYWGGAGNNLSPIQKGGDYSFHFEDVGGPMYLTAPPAFDKTKILSATIWLASSASYNDVNEIWDAWVPEGDAPARACVESKLAFPQYSVEIGVIAAA